MANTYVEEQRELLTFISKLSSMLCFNVSKFPWISNVSRRPSFIFRWLLSTFTDEGDAVIDVFAGCGELGRASKEMFCHYLGVESDDYLAHNVLEDI